MIIVNNEAALRVKCSDATENEVAEIIKQLELELDYSARLGRSGIGLAAPQIGIAKNVAIVRLENTSIDLVNCCIDKKYDKTMFRGEGCLSFPGAVEDTMRYQEIHILNNLIYPKMFVATGLLAVVCQHELDHLNSILLSDNAIKNKPKLHPNDICNCGSLKKYKRCCGR